MPLRSEIRVGLHLLLRDRPAAILSHAVVHPQVRGERARRRRIRPVAEPPAPLADRAPLEPELDELLELEPGPRLVARRRGALRDADCGANLIDDRERARPVASAKQILRENQLRFAPGGQLDGTILADVLSLLPVLHLSDGAAAVAKVAEASQPDAEGRRRELAVGRARIGELVEVVRVE